MADARVIEGGRKVVIGNKVYQTVAYRISEFRKTHSIESGWAIETECIEAKEEDNGGVIKFKATIKNPEGKAVAVGHAEEKRGSSYINKTSAYSNCETSAIGRALANAGFIGTEFASADEIASVVRQQSQQPQSKQAQPQAKVEQPKQAQQPQAKVEQLKQAQPQAQPQAKVEQPKQAQQPQAKVEQLKQAQPQAQPQAKVEQPKQAQQPQPKQAQPQAQPQSKQAQTQAMVQQPKEETKAIEQQQKVEAPKQQTQAMVEQPKVEAQKEDEKILETLKEMTKAAKQDQYWIDCPVPFQAARGRTWTELAQNKGEKIFMKGNEEPHPPRAYLHALSGWKDNLEIRAKALATLEIIESTETIQK